MTMVTLELILVVYGLLEQRTAFVNPQIVGDSLSDRGKCIFYDSIYQHSTLPARSFLVAPEGKVGLFEQLASLCRCEPLN